MSARHIPGIDGLRAIAVLAVIFYHLDEHLLPGGFAGVDIFFVISGYVVSKSLAETPFSGFRDYLTGFYARRMIRIFPALLVVLCVTLLLSWMFIPRVWLSEALTETGLRAFYALSNYRLVDLSDGYFAPRTEFNPFTHTWSLAVEEQFYLFYPLALYGWLRARGSGRANLQRLALAVVLALVLASLWRASQETPSDSVRAFYLLPSRFWELAAGGLLYVRHDRAGLRPGGVWPALLAAPLLVVSLVQARVAAFPFPGALLPVLATLLALHAVTTAPAGRFARVLSQPAMRQIGRTSYSLYLWHWPVIVLMRWTTGVATLPSMLMALVLTFLLGNLSWRLVETRVTQWVRSRSWPSWRVLLMAVMVVAVAWAGAKVGQRGNRLLNLSVTRDENTWFPGSADIVPPRHDIHLDGLQLFVVGDSHGWAFTPMIKALERDTGIRTQIYMTNPCPTANLVFPMAQTPACVAQAEGILTDIERRARPGDLVFFPALRAMRISEQYGGNRVGKVLADMGTPAFATAREQAKRDGFAIFDRLSARQLRLVVDLPRPLFLASAFRCADWFNRGNADCATGHESDRKLMDVLWAPAREVIAEAVQRYPNLSAWDTTSFFCDAARCVAMREGKPFFFDQDHVSGYGSATLYPSFVDLLAAAVRQPVPPAGEPLPAR